MIPGVLPIGQYATDELPAAQDLSTPNPFWGFFDDEYAARTYVLCVTPLQLTSTVGTFFYPAGHNPIGWLSDEDKAAPPIVYYANRELKTNATDTPANTIIPPRLNNALNFRASIPLPGGVSASGSSAFGFVRVANTGDLDDAAIGASWAGRDAVIWVGGTMNPGRADEVVLQFVDYQPLYTLQVAGITAEELSFDVTVRDPVYKLSVPIQQSTYAGDATDYEGGDDVKGQYKPVALGAVFKVPAVLVNATDYIYQYHDGSGTTVAAVYDNGIALSLQEDSTDLPNLTVTTGNYATDVSRGLVKIGDEPSSEIVLDAVGVGGATVSTILDYLGGIAGVTRDTASFNSWGNQAAGFWCDTSVVDVLTVFNELLTSIDGWWIFKRNGNVAIGEHTDVAATEPALTLDGRKTTGTVSSIVENTLRRAPGPSPVWQYKLGYKKYGATVIIDEEQLAKTLRHKFKRANKHKHKRDRHRFKLSDAINPDQISDWAQEFRKVGTVSNTLTRDYYRDAIEVEKNTHLVTESEVDTLAAAMLARDSKVRGLYTFKIARNLYKLFPGDVVTVRHDRFNLSTGKKGRIISMVEDAASETTDIEVLVNE